MLQAISSKTCPQGGHFKNLYNLKKTEHLEVKQDKKKRSPEKPYQQISPKKLVFHLHD